MFKPSPKKRYTWKMPGDVPKYQIDYMLVKQGFNTHVKHSRTYLGCGIECDHNTVMMYNQLKFNRLKKKSRIMWKSAVLKVEDTLVLYKQK